MFQRRVTAAVCRRLRTDASAISRCSTRRDFAHGNSALSTHAAGVELRDLKERLRPLGPGRVELCLDDGSGVATLFLDNPDRCNGESEEGRETHFGVVSLRFEPWHRLWRLHKHINMRIHRMQGGVKRWCEWWFHHECTVRWTLDYISHIIHTWRQQIIAKVVPSHNCLLLLFLTTSTGRSSAT